MIPTAWRTYSGLIRVYAIEAGTTATPAVRELLVLSALRSTTVADKLYVRADRIRAALRVTVILDTFYCI